MSANRRKGLSRLRLLASLREERAQRAVSDAARAQAAAEAAHVTQLEQFRLAQAAEPSARPTDAFLLQREAQALQARAISQAETMLHDATLQMEQSKSDLLDAARERMTYDRLDARARATQAALVARASMRALDDLNGQRRKA